jgi:hypothetical protein
MRYDFKTTPLEDTLTFLSDWIVWLDEQQAQGFCTDAAWNKLLGEMHELADSLIPLQSLSAAEFGEGSTDK